MVNPTNVVDVFLEEDPEPYVTVEDVSPGPVVVEVAEGAVASPSFLSGHGAPAADLGDVGQFYLDTNNGDWYGPKSATGAPVGQQQMLYPDFPALGSAGATPVGGYELGTKFRCSVPGYLLGLRFYIHPSSTQTNVTVRLWSGAGVLIATLATPVYTTGWGEVYFDEPYPALTVGDHYVTSFSVPAGMISPASTHVSAPASNTAELQWFSSHFATMGLFPASGPQSYNYGADVLFQPTTVWPLIPQPPDDHEHDAVVWSGAGPPAQYTA